MPPKHPSPTSKPRWAQRTAPASRPSLRPKLSEADIKWLKVEMRKKYGWSSDPRLFQIDGIRAQLEGEDIIIQAPTGAGKTVIAAGPHLWPTSAGKTTLMVCPLLALEEEMEDTFANEFGLKAKAVNSVGGKLTQDVVKELLAGTYQIVLISPEMLQSPAFISRVLRKPAFSRRILSLVVDEAHCVSHWGADFRKKYSTLGSIRAYLPRGTPVVAETATLTARVRQDLHRVLHFSKGQSRFTNMGNDRPNVTIVVRAMQHPQNTYTDLDFLIPSIVTHPSDVPKTYVYVDDIKVGNEIIDHLNELLHSRAAPTLSIDGLIRPYNATLPSEYRSDAMAAFRSSPSTTAESPGPASDEQQYIRILVCTDAAGMGCNVKDVARVVQWKLPKTLSNFVQRAGRAARAPNLTGLAVLLVERSVYSLDLRSSAPLATTAPSTNTKTKKKSKTSAPGSLPKGYAQRHGVERGSSSGLQDIVSDVLPDEVPQVKEEAEDEGLRAFVQANTCRRQIWSKIFDNPFTPKPAPGVPCCDICDPGVFNMTRPGTPPKSERSKAKVRAKGLPDYLAFTGLDEWRETVFRRDLATSPLDPTAVLNDDIITHLVSVGPLTAPQISSLLRDSWIWWNKYGHELTTLLCSLKIDYRPIKKKSAAQALPRTTVTPLANVVPPSRLTHIPTISPILPPPKHALDIEDATTVPHSTSGLAAPGDPPAYVYHAKRARVEPGAHANQPYSMEHGSIRQSPYPVSHWTTMHHASGSHHNELSIAVTAAQPSLPQSAYGGAAHPSSQHIRPPQTPAITSSAHGYPHMPGPPPPWQQFPPTEPVHPSGIYHATPSQHIGVGSRNAASAMPTASGHPTYSQTAMSYYPPSDWTAAAGGSSQPPPATMYQPRPYQAVPVFPESLPWGLHSTPDASPAMQFQSHVRSDNDRHLEYWAEEDGNADMA